MNLIYYIVMGMVNLLWIVGVWNALLPGQIFGSLGDWMAGNTKVYPTKERHLPEWLTKPLFECPNCMPSIHGTLWWFVFGMGPWYLLPFYIVCLSGAAKVLVITVLNHDKEA